MKSLLFIRVQPHSLPFHPHVSNFFLLFAGDIGTLVIPEGMQNLNLVGCNITGKATMVKVR